MDTDRDPARKSARRGVTQSKAQRDRSPALARRLHSQVAADGSRRSPRRGKNAPTAVGGYTLSADRARGELSAPGICVYLCPSVVLFSSRLCVFAVIQREFYGKAAALAGGAADKHSAAVGFDDVLHDAQANAHTLGLAPQLGAATVEALEDALVFGGRDAVAVVFDPDGDA
jgi:hypothetical protein